MLCYVITGPLLLFSHDRDFLQGLTDKVFEFRNKTVKVHLGDIQDYLDKTNLQSLELLNTKNLRFTKHNNRFRIGL
jgi:ATP-binding cassette subfamily F protein 3